MHTGRSSGSDYSTRSEHLLVGIMSGTSLDGIDAVLVRIEEQPGVSLTGSVRLLGQVYLPYTDELRGLLLDLCTLEKARIDRLVVAHFGLGEWYAESVRRLLCLTGVSADEVDAICLHGQTVWHAPVAVPFPAPEPEAGTGSSGGAGASEDVPPLAVTGTLQIGCAAVLGERTGIPVISDFRSADMAAGGEGAPLAPFVDALLFGSPHAGRVVQNIGGIGNATVVPPLNRETAQDELTAPAGTENGSTQAPQGIFAFDTGPGNMVMDAVVAHFSGGRERMDLGGAIAARGRVDEAIVERFMADPYYARKPPKSTGREVYGRDFVAGFLEACLTAGHGQADAVATATALTAESIARAVRDFVLPSMPVDDLVVGGGGARNPVLLAMIGERLPGVRVTTTAELGIPEDAREAIAFAVMGHETLMGRPGNLPAVTGARHPVVLGSLSGLRQPGGLAL